MVLLLALLLDAKCVCLLDGEEELLVEHLRGAVGRQVEPVEAGVRPGKERRTFVGKSHIFK